MESFIAALLPQVPVPLALLALGVWSLRLQRQVNARNSVIPVALSGRLATYVEDLQKAGVTPRALKVLLDGTGTAAIKEAGYERRLAMCEEVLRQHTDEQNDTKERLIIVEQKLGHLHEQQKEMRKENKEEHATTRDLLLRAIRRNGHG